MFPSDRDAAEPQLPAGVQLARISNRAMGAAFESNEGKSATLDMANFATGGATTYHYEVREVQAGLPEMP